MIYLFYGNDTNKARASVHDTIDVLFLKHPDANFVRTEAEDWHKEKVVEYAQTKSLFGNISIIFIDNVSEDKEKEEEMYMLADEMGDSENIFVILDADLSAKNIKTLSKIAKTAEKFITEKQRTQKDNFNMFSLTDALGERNRKKLWLLFQKGILLGIPAEEMLGLVFWQAKNLQIVKKSKSAGEANMKPFVFQKSRGYSNNYSEEETRNLLFKIVDIYHRARRGQYNLEESVEKLTLSI